MLTVRRGSATLIPLILTLTACGGAPVKDEASASSKGTVSISSCGQQMEYPKPAKRIVSLDQSTTETLLALKATDQVAGVANEKMPVPKEYAIDYRKLKMLNPKFLTGEQLRAATPDAVVTSFKSFFTANQVGTREELKQAGIPSFISAVDCVDKNPGKNAYQRLEDDYRNLGKITGHTKEADALIAKQDAAEKQAQTVRSKIKPGTKVAFVYSAYDGQPYVAGKYGMPQAMADSTGVTNIFGDVEDVWPEVQWEQVGTRNPDVIVLGDLTGRGRPGDTPAEKIKEFKTNPATKNLDAVKHNRFIAVNGVGLDPSPRSTQALTDLAKGLEKLGYTK